ncbi:UNVERIFIED_CONTAM: hypothetical protein FKN15_016493 [Acipenser sinensis]
MSLDCGRKPKYPEKTYANTGKTCKLHTDTRGRNRTLDSGAVRQQCKPLCRPKINVLLNKIKTARSQIIP